MRFHTWNNDGDDREGHGLLPPVRMHDRVSGYASGPSPLSSAGRGESVVQQVAGRRRLRRAAGPAPCPPASKVRRMFHLQFLTRVHWLLRSRQYLHIGIRNGHSAAAVLNRHRRLLRPPPCTASNGPKTIGPRLLRGDAGAS